jgi:degradative hydroxymethylglutaryl-CoA reductase
MTRAPVSAPGKAFLIGEYAVLEGVPALITAVDVRAVAHDSRDPERSAPSDLSLAAHVGARDHLARLGTAVGEVPTVDSGPFHLGARKLGLGSSAAVTAAVVGFHLAEAGHDLALPDTRALALELARAAHRQAQGGGSGGDVAAAVLGGNLRFMPGRTPEPLAHPCWLHIGFVDVGAPAVTASFVQAVRHAAQADRGAHARAIDRLASASETFFAGHTNPDPDAGLAAILLATQQHNEGLAQLQSLSGAPILTPVMLQVLALAARHGLAAKPSGAGGGDLLVVFARSQGELDLFSAQLQRELGLHLLPRLGVAAPGLRPEPRAPISSRLGGFFKLGVEGRRAALRSTLSLPAEQRFTALDPGSLDLDAADNLIENVIGTLALPLAIATNFRINGVDYLVPMAVEEASVVAAASNAAKMIRAGGGFVARCDPAWMIAQVQLLRDADHSADATIPDATIPDASTAAAIVQAASAELLALADQSHPRLLARGGGARELEVRILAPDMIVVHAIVDCQDAMGANLLNTIAEALAPRLHALTRWTPGLRILSNLADRRCSHVSCRVPPHALAAKDWPGEAVAAGIASASRFAELDPYRAATHNKGVMNGVDAVVLATGNDWRAMEAGAHAYAARTGVYRPLATWKVGVDGWLEGSISIPTAVGTVGGATKVHPAARLALELLGAHPGAGSATTLGQIMAAAGLAANLAALRALATEGIQRGHMALHARSVAIGAGAVGPEIEPLVQRLIDSGEVKHERAVLLLRHLRQ